MNSKSSLIETNNITKNYYIGKNCIPVLHNITLSIQKGDYIAIMGHSGAGKSTLLNILACLDTPSSGTYLFKGVPISAFSQTQLADIRNRDIGFVFQNFNLLPKLSIASNVELPLIYSNTPLKERKDLVETILKRFGLWERRKHKPNEISGGQKQRVAIARALIKKPSVIFADEPTGNLDSRTAEEILTIFDELSQDRNTLIVITHEHDVAKRASRTIQLSDGTIVT